MNRAKNNQIFMVKPDLSCLTLLSKMTSSRKTQDKDFQEFQDLKCWLENYQLNALPKVESSIPLSKPISWYNTKSCLLQ